MDEGSSGKGMQMQHRKGHCWGTLCMATCVQHCDALTWVYHVIRAEVQCYALRKPRKAWSKKFPESG